MISRTITGEFPDTDHTDKEENDAEYSCEYDYKSSTSQGYVKKMFSFSVFRSGEQFCYLAKLKNSHSKSLHPEGKLCKVEQLKLSET